MLVIGDHREVRNMNPDEILRGRQYVFVFRLHNTDCLMKKMLLGLVGGDRSGYHTIPQCIEFVIVERRISGRNDAIKLSTFAAEVYKNLKRHVMNAHDVLVRSVRA
jgi:hypothetical protein